MPDGKVDILFQIRSDVAQLKAAQQQASQFSNLLKTGFGISGGLLAANAIGKVKDALAGAVTEGIKFNALIEQQQVAFQTLLGSSELAGSRIRELIDFAAFTPFELPEIIQANRVLEVLSDGMLSTERGMKLVGDAASSVGRGFRETAFWVGRLAAGLESGTAVGEATLRLIELGLISGDAAKEMQRLAKEAHTTEEVWDILTDTFGKTAGAMELQSRTFNGLSATFRDFKRELKGLLTEGAFEQLKRLMEDFLEATGRLPDIEARSVESIRRIFESAKNGLKTSTLEGNEAALQAYDAVVAEQEARISSLRNEAASILRQVDAAKERQGSKGVRNVLLEQKINDALEKRKGLLASAQAIEVEIGAGLLLRATREAEFDKQRQAAQSESNRLRREEQALGAESVSLYDEALSAERLLTSQLERKEQQYLRETQSAAERLDYLDREIESIEGSRDALAERAKLFEDEEKGVKFLEVGLKRLRTQEIDALIERMKLQEQINLEAEKASKSGVEFQVAAIRQALEFIRHQKTILSNEDETATTRKEMAGLVAEEKRVLDTLVAVWAQYATTVKDPELRQALETRIQGLKFEQELLDKGQNQPSLLEESVNSFNELSDPAQHFQDVYGAAAASLLDFQAQAGTVSDQIYDQLTEIQDAMTGGIAESIRGLIVGTMDWGDALENIGISIVDQIINSFATMLAQWITTQITMRVLSAAFGVSAVTAAGLQASALAAAWAPAAIAASIATLGAASAIGNASFVASQASGTAASTSLAMASVGGAGFAEGGYTGAGSKYQIKGAVHAEEFVMPRDVVSATGPGFFYDMVDNVRTGSTGSGGAPNIAVFDNRDDMNRWAEGQDGEVWFKDMLDMHKGELV